MTDTSLTPGYDRRMLEALTCPQTQGSLVYDPAAQELISKTANLAFPIRNGIPIMLADEARVLD
ncbi:MAG: Trm112 family protein [Pseudomonadota bacterium]